MLTVGKQMLFTLVLLTLLCGCSENPAPPLPAETSDAVQTDTPDTSADISDSSSDSGSQTDAAPKTLEQELLRRRGIPYEQSDYKKFIGGENIIDKSAEFDCNLDHAYSKNINDLVVAGGKLYQANFNTVLANGENLSEIGTLPGRDIQYWYLTHDGEMGTVYLKDGSGYTIRSVPFTAVPLDGTQHPLFQKVYRYASDGKTLEDHTAEYLNADKIYDVGIPMFAFTRNRVSLLFSGKYLDGGTTGWNWYRDMGRKEYIAFDLDLSEIGNEVPIRLFNSNILMTDCAFYEIVYASDPIDENDERTQSAPDGTVSPYYPAAPLLNCKLKLRRLELLSTYYDDVKNISTSHVITADYTMLPIMEVITDGYSEYIKYDCRQFCRDFDEQS